jgi:hypothetical protein
MASLMATENVIVQRTLLLYHRYKHQQATKLLIDFFTASTRGRFTDNTECQPVIYSLDKINERIRGLNWEHGEDDELGIIDYRTIAYSWVMTLQSPGAAMKLKDLCWWKQYPVG